MFFLGAMFEPVLFLNSMCAWSMEVGKTVDQSFGASLKKPVFCRNLLKMTILTSVWNAQHPNAGRNIQQTGIPVHAYAKY